jgi:hypothetical protein
VVTVRTFQPVQLQRLRQEDQALISEEQVVADLLVRPAEAVEEVEAPKSSTQAILPILSLLVEAVVLDS